jgi:repressor LexA
VEIGKLINKRRTELGLTLEEVGNAVGVSKSTVKKWEDGFISNMRRDKISELAKILKLNPVSLITGDEDPIQSNIANVLPQENIRMIPVFESVSAGFGAYPSNYIVDYVPCYIVNDEEAENTICITVQGNSMYPKIENGDVIQVLRQDGAESGQIAVVLIDNEDAVVKKIIYDDDAVTLLSINPEYAPREFTGAERERLRILGVVRKIIKSV